MRRPPLRVAALAACACIVLSTGAGLAQTAPAHPPRTMQEVLDSAKPGDWRDLDPARTLYMDLDGGRVVIELAPEFAPAHVANIRALAKGGYWNGLMIVRSQDNYVVQWGDPEEDDTKRKPLSKGAKAKLPAEFARDSKGLAFTRLPDVDGWADQVGFSGGFPVARSTDENLTWLANCYGTVGAGRNNEPDSSNGSELYVIIGQSPRHLDRNITSVGRVVKGMEVLSVMPRGTGPLGFYETPEQRVPIRAVRLAADFKPAERMKLQILRTDTPLFEQLVEVRRNRHDDFYKRPAGHIDVCNVPIPVREAPAPGGKPKR